MENKVSKLVEFQIKLRVPKGQYNDFGKYKYRSAEDIIEAVKLVINPEGFYLLICDDIVQIGNRYYIKATVILTNGTESYTSVAWAREEETKKGMDGSQITGAASSYARKYALNGLFAIDDTKDADATNDHKEVKKELPALTSDMPAWGKVVKYLKDGGVIADVRKKYNIPEEVENKLMEEAL